MSKFIINGAKQLSGEINVAGSKNALFPLFAAAILTTEECRFTNVPEIKDREVMAELLRTFGVQVFEGEPHTVVIRAKSVESFFVHPTLSGKLRGSIVLLGALLGRSREVNMGFPGGDIIGKRSIEAHLSAFRELGAEVLINNNRIRLQAKRLVGTKIILEESSVTATENAILASVCAEETTVIKLAAMEPHVQQLCEFLNKMGAKISGIGTTTLTIKGVSTLYGAEMELIPDSNEAASLITLAAATKSDVKVTNLNPDFLDDFLLRIRKIGVNFEVGENFVHVHQPTGDYQGTKIQCGLYPKLASDDVPALAVLATQAQGDSLVYEWLYENRLGYIDQLKKMGAQAEILDPHRVKITGPTALTSAKITSYDIRMGMTLVIAALVADGESEIDGIEHIDRGYESLEARLGALGADIKRVESN